MKTVELLTDPNQGTRKLILPIIGLVQLTEGIFSCPAEQVEELRAVDLGFKLKGVLGVGSPKIKKEESTIVPQPENIDALGDSDSLSKEEMEEGEISYNEMNMETLRGLVTRLREENVITDDEYKKALKMPKPKLVEFVQSNLEG
jgi:hypothetical protein